MDYHPTAYNPADELSAVNVAPMFDHDVNVLQALRTTHVEPDLPLALHYSLKSLILSPALDVCMTNSYMHCNVVKFRSEANSLCYSVMQNSTGTISRSTKGVKSPLRLSQSILNIF